MIGKLGAESGPQNDRERVSQHLSNWRVHQSRLQTLWKRRRLGPAPGVSASRDQKLAFLASSQVRPMLLVWGPHFENHCST